MTPAAPQPDETLVSDSLSTRYNLTGAAKTVKSMSLAKVDYIILDLQTWYEGSALVATNQSNYKPISITVPISIQVLKMPDLLQALKAADIQYDAAADAFSLRADESVHLPIIDNVIPKLDESLSSSTQKDDSVKPKEPVMEGGGIPIERNTDYLLKYQEHFAVIETCVWLSKSPTKSEGCIDLQMYMTPAREIVSPLSLIDPDLNQDDLLIITHSTRSHAYAEDLYKNFTFGFEIPANYFTTDLRKSMIKVANKRYMQNHPFLVDDDGKEILDSDGNPIPSTPPPYDGRWYLHIAAGIYFIPSFLPFPDKIAGGET